MNSHLLLVQDWLYSDWNQNYSTFSSLSALITSIYSPIVFKWTEMNLFFNNGHYRAPYFQIEKSPNQYFVHEYFTRPLTEAQLTNIIFGASFVYAENAIGWS